jgi:cell wall-associated NlpC family hydrolase
MTCRLLIRAATAFTSTALAALVVAPTATRAIVTVGDAQAARNPEGRVVPVRRVTAGPTLGERAVFFAVENVGVPYRWGGESPASGFDCSGLVRWSYGRVGLDLPHNSHALYSVGRRVARNRLAAGDVLFFEGLGHVGLYLGKGRMVHAPYSGKHVEIVRLSVTNYGRRLIGARRVGST